MKHRITLLAYTLLTTLLLGCASSDSPFTEGGGAGVSSLPISDKNFELVFDPIDPEVLDDDGFHSGVEVKVTALAGDRDNVASGGGTVFFKTDWGILDSSSCQIVNGSCTITWTANANFADIPDDLFITFTAHALGEESYIDLNGNNQFDDGDGNVFIRDLPEPFLDINHDGTYTLATDVIIDLDGNGIHTPADTKYNGPTCTHSTLCSPAQLINILSISYLNLDARTPPTPGTSITSPNDGSTAVSGTSLTFTVNAIDAEDGTITGTNTPFPGNNIVWSSNVDGIFGPSSSSFNFSTLSVGLHTITVTVTDSDANVTTDTVDITVTATPVFNVTIDAPTTGHTVVTGTNITFTATAIDPEDGTITATDAPVAGDDIVWSSDLDGVFGTSNSSITVNTLSVGTHVITVTATDSAANVVTDTISVTVTP